MSQCGTINDWLSHGMGWFWLKTFSKMFPNSDSENIFYHIQIKVRYYSFNRVSYTEISYINYDESFII